MKDMNDPYKDLAEAVCLQAVDDYRNARYFFEVGRFKKKYTEKTKKYLMYVYKKYLKTAAEFLNDPAFELYSGLDGEKIYKRLKAECDNGNYGLLKRGGGYGKR